jgi:hypothetical protein
MKEGEAVLSKLSDEGILPGQPDNTLINFRGEWMHPSLAHMRLEREFNEKENQRKAEEERKRQEEREQEHQLYERLAEERKQREQEYLKKLTEERMEKLRSKFKRGTAHSCYRCGTYVKYLPCSNERCGAQIPYGPLVKKLYQTVVDYYYQIKISQNKTYQKTRLIYKVKSIR